MAAVTDQALDGSSAELLLALTPGIGPRLRKALLDHFGSAAAVVGAAASDLRAVPGIGQKLSRSIVTARQELDLDATLRDCQENGVKIIAEPDANYPQTTRNIPDPPGVLFVRGEIRPSDGIAV